jgi:hypothetical protein
MGKCLYGQMSLRANVFMGKCLLGKCLLWAIVFMGKRCMGKCHHGQILYTQMSLGKCLWANLVWANIIEPVNILFFHQLRL